MTRLIDADALKERLLYTDIGDEEGHYYRYRFVYECDIDEMPTIEPKKVVYLCDGRACGVSCGTCKHTSDITHAKHFEKKGGAFYEKHDEPKRGRWLSQKEEGWAGGGVTRCSRCNFGYAWGAFHEVEEFNYCPNCGAKMEEEDETD